MSSKLYDNYHYNQKYSQNSIISRRNYTYQTIIGLIDKYQITNKEILDIGCGVGTIDFFLASTNKYVLGIDISNIALRKAKETAKNLGIDNRCHFMTINLDNEWSLGKKFDVIICSEVLEHIRADDKLVQNINNLAKSECVLIISVPLLSAPLYRMGLLTQWDKTVGHLRRYDNLSLYNLLRILDFDLIEVIDVEGILRNFLYTTKIGSFLLKFVKGPIVDVVNYLDLLTIKCFGPSNKYLIFKR